MMDAGCQPRPGGPGHGDGAAVRHAASEHAPGPSGYDAELRRHNEVLRRAFGVQLHDHVLDIGCGTGQTTRQAARTARPGSALGVDISAPAIERARELARAEGLRNVTFEHADAQVHRFPQERFDLAISRFGTMFFDDPGRRVRQHQAGAAPGRAAGNDGLAGPRAQRVGRRYPPIPRGSRRASGRPFRGTGSVLARRPAGRDGDPAAAGFADVAFTDVHEPVYYGPDVAAALDWVRGFACTSEVLKRLDPAAAARAAGRLREALAAHLSDDGVWFNSRAWIVTARRH